MILYKTVEVAVTIAGSESQSLTGQTVELDREPDTIEMGVDGKMSVGRHLWTIIWLDTLFPNWPQLRNAASPAKAAGFAPCLARAWASAGGRRLFLRSPVSLRSARVALKAAGLGHCRLESLDELGRPFSKERVNEPISFGLTARIPPPPRAVAILRALGASWLRSA